MRDIHDELAAKQTRVVVVGNGRPSQAKAFRDGERIPFELWVDPDMQAYRAAGLKRGVTSALSLRILAHAWRALRRGFWPAKVQGDPWQLGGVLVISQQGETVYHQISREAGDHAPIPDLLAAADRARGEATKAPLED